MGQASLIELRQLPQTDRLTLHRLIDPAPPLTDPDVHTGRQRADWSAVVDDDQRPVGLVHRRAEVNGLIQSLVANVHSSPSEIGQRIATAPDSEPCAPIIVVDNGGRYLGLVSIRRLIRSLSS